MKKDLTHYSAYHGKTWKSRLLSLEEERDSGYFWSSYKTDSEYGELKAVLLYSPGKEVHQIKVPDRFQHLKKIDQKKMAKEFALIKRAFERENVLVFQINPHFFADTPPVNLMYVRDLFWNGKEGSILARMGSLIRAGEEKYAATALSLLSIPILSSIHQKGLFEGADLLWLNSKTLLCGIGNRTNKEALKQIQEVMKKEKIKIVPVVLPKKVQHLLGMLQIVDRKKALIRSDIAPKKLIEILKKEKFSLVHVSETDEVINRQGMNIVTIRPNEIFMPKDCPELNRLYKKNKIKVLAELEITQLLAGAGGLACATGIIARKNCE
ncbi:MAG: dimethylarginine dimethylaminohydrolase family protein [Bacteriovorax sp.]